MNNRIILFFVALALIFQSCYKDDTSGATRELSTIRIDLGINEGAIVDLNLNEEYLFSPTITQDRDLPLSYEWEVDHVILSTEKDFTYSGSRLGTYKARLKVSNEDGSTFHEFTIRVNSQYEEGLLILGEDATEEATLSFIPAANDGLIAQTPMENVDINSFAKSNPDNSLGKKPTDLAVRQLQIFVSSEEGGISMINYKTLGLEGVVRSPDFPDFKPVIMNIQDNFSRSALILTRSGKIYSLATLEYIISNYANADTVRLDLMSQYVLDLNYTNNYYWDSKNSKLWNFRNIPVNTGDELRGQEIVSFFTASGRTHVLSVDKNDPTSFRKTVFPETIAETRTSPPDVLERHYFTNSNMTLNVQSKTLLDEYYLKLIYANGRDLYRYFYTTNTVPTSPFASLDIPGEITSLAKNEANKELYVGVYDPNAAGLKGSVVVYDLETGAKKATFANIADKPIKLFYKIRK